MDLGLSDSATDSYLTFQGMLKREYEKLAGPEGFQIVDAEQQIEELSNEVRRGIRPLLQGFPKEEVLVHAD